MGLVLKDEVNGSPISSGGDSYVSAGKHGVDGGKSKTRTFVLSMSVKRPR